MRLRRVASSSFVTTLRITGSVRFPQSAVEGRFSTSTAGDDRLRTDVVVDGAVKIWTVLNKGRAWAGVSGGRVRELAGKPLAQLRLGHPSVLFGDWRKYYDAVRVVRAGELGGRRIYAVQLESAGLPPAMVSLDVETGDVLQVEQPTWFPEIGAIPTTTTYSDYREVGGMRVPHRYVAAPEIGGGATFQVERVQVGVKPGPDTFKVQSSIKRGSGR